MCEYEDLKKDLEIVKGAVRNIELRLIAYTLTKEEVKDDCMFDYFNLF